jgi:hypothetical protein
MTKNEMLPEGLALAVLLSMTGLSAPALARDLPPAEEVLTKYSEAIGGEAVGRVANMAAEFEFEMPVQGVYASGLEFWEKPGRHYLRIDLASSGVPDYESGVLDGVAWESHPMNGTRKLEGSEARERLRRASLNPFASWKEDFEKAQTVSEEAVGGKACYKVVFTPADGPALNAFFEKDSGLLLRQEIVGPTTTTIELGDYEESQGILSARALEQSGTQSFSLKYTSVKYDVDEIPAGTFELPASLTAAASE